jgi:hypothetical protein
VSLFWRAVKDLDPDAADESELAGAREGHLVEVFRAAGLRDVRPAVLTVGSRFSGFGEWWEPFTLGVGPAGAYVERLDARGKQRLRGHCASLLPDRPFEITAWAWAAVGRT